MNAEIPCKDAELYTNSIFHNFTMNIKIQIICCNLENFVKLIMDVPDSRKSRSSRDHLDEDAADPPEIEGRGVVG